MRNMTKAEVAWALMVLAHAVGDLRDKEPEKRYARDLGYISMKLEHFANRVDAIDKQTEFWEEQKRG